MSDNTIPLPALRSILRLQIQVAPPQLLGRLNGQERRMIAILGGHAEGLFSGTILPGGSDIQTVREDGTIELLARYALDAGEAGKVLIENTGLRRATGEGEAPYFRGWMRFEAAAGPLDWLNRALFLSSGYREGGVVHLGVFEVL